MIQISEEFKKSIRCGTGRAYIIQLENSGQSFDRLILNAAKKNYAYDPQCEGDRARYVSSLIDTSKNTNILNMLALQQSQPISATD